MKITFSLEPEDVLLLAAALASHKDALMMDAMSVIPCDELSRAFIAKKKAQAVEVNDLSEKMRSHFCEASYQVTGKEVGEW